MTQEFRSDLVKLVPRLRRFAYSLTNSRADADDLVQAACERALRNQESFRVGTRMDSWLYRIIQNLWLDDRRRGTVRGVAVDPEEAGLSDAGRSARLPEDRLMLGQVRAAMETLPEAQRAADGAFPRRDRGLELPRGGRGARRARRHDHEPAFAGTGESLAPCGL